MKLLLDTHILLWAAGQPDRLSDNSCRRFTRILLTVFLSVRHEVRQ